jgi:pimeloyl-ACP methyl ester carboxylesterase
MANIQNGSSLILCNVTHLSKTLLLKLHIPNCKNFVHYQYLTIQMGCNSKCQFNIHTTRISLNRRINELVHFCKFNNSDRANPKYIITSIAYQLAMAIPEAFAAIVPVCGGGMYWAAKRLVDVPVWAFHGAQDKTVLPEESLHMVAKVNAFGGNAKLTLYPNNAHDAWTDTYSNPEVYAWLLEHTKGESA